MIKPAIVAVGYNRPKLMKRLLNSIGAAYFDTDDIPLIISIDESNRSDEVENVAKEFIWKYGKKIIRRFPERQGLRKHIIQCGDLSNEYGAVIILEDDLYVSVNFYNYICAAHNYYSSYDMICGISLYNHCRNQFTNDRFTADVNGYDTYLGAMVVTWGQSWTKNQWNSFKEWYLRHEDMLPEKKFLIPDEILSWDRSWGKYYASYIADNNLYYVYPYYSLTTCFAEVGEHNKDIKQRTLSQVPLLNDIKTYRFAPINKAVKYDSFYERVLDSCFKTSDISGDKICFDLGGMKRDSFGATYVISSKKLSYPVIASFGLCMRPVERNIIENIPGKFFFLYKLPDGKTSISTTKKKKYQYTISYDRLRYEHFENSWRVLLKYFVWEFINTVKTKILNYFQIRL